MAELTRAEVREKLEAQNPRCRGPRRELVKVCWLPLARSQPALEEEALTLARAAGHEAEAAEEALEALKSSKAKTDEVLHELFQQGELRLARLVDDWSRDPCGENLVELELSEPLDGLLHEAPCPGCGRTVEWRPPFVEGDEGR